MKSQTVLLPAVFHFSLFMCLCFDANLGDEASGGTVKGHCPSSSICRSSFPMTAPRQHSTHSQKGWGQGSLNHVEHSPAVSQAVKPTAWERVPRGTYAFTHLFWCFHTRDSYGEIDAPVHEARAQKRWGLCAFGAVLHCDNTTKICPPRLLCDLSGVPRCLHQGFCC